MTKEKRVYINQFANPKEKVEAGERWEKELLKKQRESYEKIEQEWLVGKGLVSPNAYPDLYPKPLS